jgi:hypothetical protein
VLFSVAGSVSPPKIDQQSGSWIDVSKTKKKFRTSFAGMPASTIDLRDEAAAIRQANRYRRADGGTAWTTRTRMSWSAFHSGWVARRHR